MKKQFREKGRPIPESILEAAASPHVTLCMETIRGLFSPEVAQQMSISPEVTREDEIEISVFAEFTTCAHLAALYFPVWMKEDYPVLLGCGDEPANESRKTHIFIPIELITPAPVDSISRP